MRELEIESALHLYNNILGRNKQHMDINRDDGSMTGRTRSRKEEGKRQGAGHWHGAEKAAGLPRNTGCGSSG